MGKKILISIMIILIIMVLFSNSLKIKLEYFATIVDPAKYPNMVYQKDTNLMFLNIPSDVDGKPVNQKTGIFNATQIKYECDDTGSNCQYDLIY